MNAQRDNKLRWIAGNSAYLRKWVKIVTAAITSPFNSKNKHSGVFITNYGATATTLVYLPASPPKGFTFMAVVGAAYVLNIQPKNASHQFIMGGTTITAGQGAYADDEGEMMIGTFIGSNKWLMGVTGTWTATSAAHA